MSPARSAALQAALAGLQKVRARHGGASAHRGLGRLAPPRHLLVQLVGLPVLFGGLLLALEPQLLTFWRECILFWSGHLGIPLHAGGGKAGLGEIRFDWVSLEHGPLLPGAGIGLATALASVAAFAASFWLRDDQLPLKYLLRMLCVLQAAAVLFFLVAPSQFLYTVPDHLLALIGAGYALMVMIPVMLAVGYYVLRIPLRVKITHTALIIGYFAVMIPHQAVLHALLLQHLSVLFMPVLYIFCGAVFDVLIFVALYSFAASTVPAQATS